VQARSALSSAVDYALDLFRRKYPRVDVGHVVRSLVHFADVDADPRPLGLTGEHWEAIKGDFRTRIKALA
jgi:hypothetical protein